MLISLLLIAIAARGGFAITYLMDDDAPRLWRIAAGNVIGAAVLGTAGFALALLFGLHWLVVAVALGVTLSPVLLFYSEDRRHAFFQDWTRANGKLKGASSRKSLRFAYYAGFFLLFFFFFDRAILESEAGIFTGGSQNLGDLPFHLGAIFSFTEINNFPPQNPSFAGARFSYPFIADLLTSFSVKLGSGVRDAMFVQNVSWAFSLLVILERFVMQLTRGDRLAARLAPVLLFFSGGLGFIWFFGDYWEQTRGFFDLVGQLSKDYTIGDGFRWGNSMVVLFITQRSLLLGMPLTLIVLGYLWKAFATEHTEKPRGVTSAAAAVVGLIAGLLPLIHLHSLAVLFVVSVFLFVLRPERWMTWISFAAGVAVIAVPELIWSLAGSATETSKFFAWHFGWDKGDKNFFWFWFTNTGILIPLILAGIYLKGISQGREEAKQKGADAQLTVHDPSLMLFYLPFAFLFLVSNVAKLAPWEWDNIKVLIYWFVGSLPFAAFAISRLWQRSKPSMRILATLCVAVLIGSGVLDVWRIVSGQINYKVFDADAVEIAKQIKVRTPADALFLNAPTYNTAIVLTGRQSLMRYPGHLGSHGIDYGERESDVKRIYQGVPEAPALMDKYGIRYVIVSPEERSLNVNEQFFSRFPVAAESGAYRVYRIR
jgi:hypothetical protein